MAQFDLKKATIRFCDGRKAALTTTAANGVNAQLTLTDKDTHRGTRPAVSIRLIQTGNNTALSTAVVNSTDIEVTLATDAGGAITSTAAQVKTSIEGLAAAAALVTVTLPGTGAAVVSAQVKTSLTTGARTLTLKVGEGNISYTERKNRTYFKDRGKLSGVRDGDEEPVDLRVDAIWEFITASTGGTPTPEDALKNRGEAAAWVTTSSDTCEPFCVDLEVEFNPNCNSEKREFLMLESFRYEQIEHGLKDGMLNFTGKCNVVVASVYRVT